MIVRENKHSFTMIEQHHHAHIAKEAMMYWQGSSLVKNAFRKTVLYAILHHDRGWRMFDREPFWNDAEAKPYSFTTFPTLAKTVLYRQGVDEVEAVSPYAALLCSKHYCRFMQHVEAAEAKDFIAWEKNRQQRIMETLSSVDENMLNDHYNVLQFADNLSLYICLNEPGVAKPNEHPFFKEGIPAVDADATENKIHAYWKDAQTVELAPFPFSDSFQITVLSKTIPKEKIKEIGLLRSYKEANEAADDITLQKGFT